MKFNLPKIKNDTAALFYRAEQSIRMNKFIRMDNQNNVSQNYL